MNRAERRAQRSKAAAFTYRMNIAKEQKKIKTLNTTRGVQVVSFPTDHDKALAAKAVQKRRDREIHALMKLTLNRAEFDSNA